MNEKLLRIGEVSNLLGISIQSIRHYEKKGLIKPSFIDENSGYRYFGKNDISKLWGIVILKSAGFSLKEISDIGNLELDEIEEIMLSQKKKLEEKIEKEKIALNYVNRNIIAIESLSKADELVGEYKYIKNRYGKGIETTDLRSFEEHYGKLAKVKGDYGMNQEVVYQPSRQIEINEKGNTKLKRLFAINADQHKNIDGDICQEACLYYSKITVFKDKSTFYYNQMIDEIIKDGYKLRGDSIELILIDDSLSRNVGAFVCEIQIAVI